MNRSVMQRQMFAGGGAAGLKPIPAGNRGLPNLPENVRNNMGYMAEGGDPMMMPEAAQGIMATAPAMGAPSPEMLAQEGANMMDPNALAGMIEGAEASGFSDPEAAGSFEEMMNSVSGENKSAEERRSDLASIVGPEDAGQTPESVLALVTPVVELALVDQGIGPMAQEQMNTPVEGDMGQGIMTMAANGNMGVGNEPPVNFNLGGEVRRRGDEDPVPVFMNGGPVQYFAPENTNRVATVEPMMDYQQKVGDTAKALLPTFQAFMPTKSAEERKEALQSDILFDIANTALAFAAPMQGEKEGMSAAERLAMAAQQTKLLPTISARTAASRKEAAAADTAAKTAALQGALGLETARLKQVGAERVTSLKEAQENARTLKTLSFKKQEGISERAHKKALANQKTQLEQYLQSLKGRQDLESIAARATYEDLLQKLKGEQELNQIGVKHENNLEAINTEIIGRKDVANINNIASMERKIKDIESNEKITDKNNATKQLISNEKNNTDKLINQNNIEQKNRRLEFDKVRETNLVADRRAKNQQAIAELDLDKVTEARKTLEGLRDFELKKAQGERDQQKIALIEKELNEVKIAETQIKKFSAEKRAENDVNVLAFKNKELNKLVQYRKESNQIKSEMNQITRSNNVVNQQLKDKELALKKHKAQLEIFGSGVRGRVMNIMADPNRYESYAEGADDNVLEQAITDYASEQTDVKTGAKTQRELPPYMKEVLKKRLAKGLSIPVPISKLGLSKSELEQYAPVSDKDGEASLNKIIDPNVDLTQATGLMSTLNMGMRWAAGQASEFIPGGARGDIFSTTSTGRKMLSALANATEGFLREAVSNDRLDKDTVALIRQDIMRPSGGITDANALAQLKQTRQTMKATVDRLNKMIDNPSDYTDKQVTNARGTVNLIEDLISNYSLAISGYEKSFNQGSGAEADKVFKKVFKRRPKE
jgi:hypothetical protein